MCHEEALCTPLPEEVLMVIEDDETEVDIRGERTLANIKNYNIRSAIYNFTAAWQDLNVPVLSNSWKRLIADKDTVRFLGLLRRGGEISTSIDDITDWLDKFDLDPGYEVLSEADIVASVVVSEEEESSDEEETMKVPKVKLSTLRTYIDALIDYSSYSQLPEMAHHYGNLRMIRELIIKEQQMGVAKPKLAAFLDLVILFKMVLFLVNPHIPWEHLLSMKIGPTLTHIAVIVPSLLETMLLIVLK